VCIVYLQIVEEKMVKPINMEEEIKQFQGELTKDAVLRKVMLKKELYNKV